MCATSSAVPLNSEAYSKVVKTCFRLESCGDGGLHLQKLRGLLARGGPWVELGRVGDRRPGSFEKVAAGVHSDLLSSLKVAVPVFTHACPLPFFRCSIELSRFGESVPGTKMRVNFFSCVWQDAFVLVQIV